MAALALSGSSDACLARLMPADLLAALHSWLGEALASSNEEPVNSDLRETVSSCLAVCLRVPPQINRISASRIGPLVAALQNSKKNTKSLLVNDSAVVAAATSVRDAWTRANAEQKASGTPSPGDLPPAAGAAAGASRASAGVAPQAPVIPIKAVVAAPQPAPVSFLPPPDVVSAPSFDSWSLSDINDVQPKAKKVKSDETPSDASADRSSRHKKEKRERESSKASAAQNSKRTKTGRDSSASSQGEFIWARARRKLAEKVGWAMAREVCTWVATGSC